MDGFKMSFGESASINRSPSYKSEKYTLWEERMRVMHEFDLFTMIPNETIEHLHLRFTNIINCLFFLGKTFTNVDLVENFLRCLSSEWLSKVTTIVESKDFKSLDLPTLLGKLKEDEAKLMCLKDNEATMCLMAIDEKEDTSSNVSSSSDDDISIDDLKSTFFEMHEVANRYAQKCKEQEKQIALLESKVSTLLIELHDLKVELDSKKLLDNIPTINCECDACPRKDKEILELKSIVNKFNKASNNLDTCLSAQKHACDKTGLGFCNGRNNKAKANSHVHVPLYNSFAPLTYAHNPKNVYANKNIYATRKGYIPNKGAFDLNWYANNKYVPNRPRMYARKYVCHYCGLEGHLSTYCYAKLYHVPNGKLMWVPKGTIANHQGPNVWVPMK